MTADAERFWDGRARFDEEPAAGVHALDDPRLWRRPVADERYLLVSRS